MSSRGGTPALGTAFLLLICVCLSSCASDSGDSGLPVYTSGTATADPEGLGTAAASPAASVIITYEPGDPKGEGAWAVVGYNAARTSEEKAAVEAYYGQTQIGLEAFNTLQVDRQKFASVMTDTIVEALVGAVKEKQGEDQYTIGQMILNVTGVEVSGSSATLHVCDDDGTFEINGDGVLVGNPPGTLTRDIGLVLDGASWLVDSYTHTDVTCNPIDLYNESR